MWQRALAIRVARAERGARRLPATPVAPPSPAEPPSGAFGTHAHALDPMGCAFAQRSLHAVGRFAFAPGDGEPRRAARKERRADEQRCPRPRRPGALLPRFSFSMMVSPFENGNHEAKREPPPESLLPAADCAHGQRRARPYSGNPSRVLFKRALFGARAAERRPRCQGYL